jgi:dTDP-4-dehydrorhamnose 3,5-epimerase-like enzyme
LWNESDLGIPWPVSPENVIVSEKDSQGATLRKAEVFA